MFSLSKQYEEIVAKQAKVFFNVAKNCLKPKKDEKILIITDYGLEGSNLALMLAYGYKLGLEQKGFLARLVIQDIKKGFMHVDKNVQSAINRLPEKSIIIVCVSNKLGRFGEQKSFRKFCKEKGHRFISASGLLDARNTQLPLFLSAMNINYSRLQKRGKLIKKELDKAKELRIWTEKGTDITVNIEGMKAISNDGAYHEAGSGGNVPAGEVYIAPKGIRGVNGKVVLDGSIRHEKGSKLLEYPITLNIKEGKIETVEGEEADLLLKTFEVFENRAKYPERVRLIGEIGIGMNTGAVLMGLAIMDEKVDGTAHVGIGSNSWFGGEIKTIFHGDQTFKDPVFYIDGKKINF